MATMDKSGSVNNVAKNIIAGPEFPPVREVEYGCEHIQEFMTANGEAVAEKLTTAFTDLQAQLNKTVEIQRTVAPSNPKKIPVTTLRATYMCLQCSTISSIEDKDAHSQTKKHCFAIESRSGCLWCNLCEDFVYDPLFERIRLDQTGPPAAPKKRKRNSIYPTGEEDRFVIPNSNSLSCQAGLPRGCYNMGQTCYLSVILQAMIHNPMMRNYFLSSRHDTTECEIDNCVICALTISFCDMLATEKLDGHGPVDLLYRSWKHNTNLAGYAQQDAHEYYQSLVDHLHTSFTAESPVQSKNCDCLFHQIFSGNLKSTVTCLTCRNITTKEETIVDLSISLEHHVKRRKLNPKGPGLGNKLIDEKAPLELTQCLKNFTSPEKLTGDTYRCRSAECGDTPQKARKHLTIRTLPPALCINLKRYENKTVNPSKVDAKLNFPLQLDMLPYTSRAHRHKKKGLLGGVEPIDVDPSNPSTPLHARSPGWYDLSAVVVHLGKINAGHYVCYCRRNDQWFKFDDNKVTLASETQVLQAEAYMLFYVIRNLGPSESADDKNGSGVNGSRSGGRKKAGDGGAEEDAEAAGAEVDADAEAEEE